MMVAPGFDKEWESIASFCLDRADKIDAQFPGVGSKAVIFQTCVQTDIAFWTHQELLQLKEAVIEQGGQ